MLTISSQSSSTFLIASASDVTQKMLGGISKLSATLVFAAITFQSSPAASSNLPRTLARPDDLPANANPIAHARRKEKLGHASQGASTANCASNIDLQLFQDGETIHFKPHPASCRSGKAYVGASNNGRMQINLVPGHNDNSNGNAKGNNIGKTNGKANGKEKRNSNNNSSAPPSFVASVNDLDTGAVYAIQPDANGQMFVEERMQEDYPDEADPQEDDDEPSYLDHVSIFDGSTRSLIESDGSSSSGSLRGSISSVPPPDNKGNIRFLESNTNTQLDVMVVWTKYAECRNSNQSRECTLNPQTTNNMRARINLAIKETNVAYKESGVTAELRLVHAYLDDTYTEADEKAFSAALSAVRSNGNVQTKRSQYGADIVAMIIDDSQYCGIGYLGPRNDLMFSVTAWNCATGYYSFGHEIGHNMGLNHDRGTTNSCSNSNYNYGYRDPAGSFRSILAYSCQTGQCDGIAKRGCTRVQRFSNTAKQYNGKAIGTAGANNAQKINDVKDMVAGYYPTVDNPETSSSTTTTTTTTTTSTTTSTSTTITQASTTTQPPPTTTSSMTTIATTMTTFPPSQSSTHSPSTSPSTSPSNPPSQSPTNSPAQTSTTTSTTQPPPPSTTTTQASTTSAITTQTSTQPPSTTTASTTTTTTTATTQPPPTTTITTTVSAAASSSNNCGNYYSGGACKSAPSCQWNAGRCVATSSGGSSGSTACIRSRYSCPTDGNTCCNGCHPKRNYCK